MTEPAVALELAHEVLARGELLTVRSVGWSMGSTIPAGARVQLRRPGRSPVATGDIIVYGVDDRLVGHRVVSRWRHRGTAWVLPQGDALRMPDAPVREDRVLARVTGLVTAQGEIVIPPGSPFSRVMAALVALAWRIRQWLNPAGMP